MIPKPNKKSLIKQILKVTLSAIICIFIISCNKNTASDYTEINFETTEVDFGELNFKCTNDYSFVFTNVGHKPLLIQSVKSSCGCTVSKWPRKPVAPQKKDEIYVTFNALSPGVFFKTITVFYNGKNSPDTLEIKGIVKYPN